MVKTNCSTLGLHTVYNIQQSATQVSNDTTHRLSRRTAATTRFSPEGIYYRLPETDGAKVLPTSDQVSPYLASIHHTRWRHLSTHPINNDK